MHVDGTHNPGRVAASLNGNSTSLCFYYLFNSSISNRLNHQCLHFRVINILDWQSFRKSNQKVCEVCVVPKSVFKVVAYFTNFPIICLGVSLRAKNRPLHPGTLVGDELHNFKKFRERREKKRQGLHAGAQTRCD